MAKYSESSPWHNTPTNDSNEYMDLLRPRAIPAAPDDVVYEIEPQYNYRPDLLAYDLYGNPKLEGVLLRMGYSSWVNMRY